MLGGSSSRSGYGDQPETHPECDLTFRVSQGIIGETYDQEDCEAGQQREQHVPIVLIRLVHCQSEMGNSDSDVGRTTSKLDVHFASPWAVTKAALVTDLAVLLAAKRRDCNPRT